MHIAAVPRDLREFPRALALLLIRLYQLTVSPLLPRSCRFEPTCSEYAREAIARHGLSRGLALGVRRLCRCRPGHHGGWDPVP